MAHRDRETSGICLKSIKENHYFLEENPLAIKAWRRHPSASNRCLIQNSCTKPTPSLPGQQSSPAKGTGPWLCFTVAKRQQWVWVQESPLASKLKYQTIGPWLENGEHSLGELENPAHTTQHLLNHLCLHQHRGAFGWT